MLLSLYVMSTIFFDFVLMKTLSWEGTGSSEFFYFYPDFHVHGLV